MNITTETRKRVSPGSRSNGRNYAVRVAAFKRAFGAWKHLRIDHAKELARLRRERDRKLPSLKRDR